jgi:outer membrane protein OmpA-like peptidoglycan-associated protein
MKKTWMALFFLAAAWPAPAQFGGILDKAKKKAEEKVTKKADQKTDDALEGKDGTQGSGESGAAEAGGNPSGGTGIKAYSKFDFVPGQVVLAFDDFMQDEVGNFPAKWNTNASGEVVTLEGKPGQWFMLTAGGVFLPEYIDSLPDNFTLEFDLVCDRPQHAQTFYAVLSDFDPSENLVSWRSSSNNYVVTIYPSGGSTTSERRKMGVGEGSTAATSGALAKWDEPVHVAIWRQKERVRVYFNESKAWDIPKAVAPEAKLGTFLINVNTIDESFRYYIGNLRLAVGAPDTRSKLITEGKWVTTGILFDVNSANIKPTSYGTLKEIAGVLKENAGVRVKIIGHTDADGQEAANLDLSKRRAASVKEFLAKEFSIDESRMETDGLGESKPVDKNDTPAGKANNRRVEFVKM